MDSKIKENQDVAGNASGVTFSLDAGSAPRAELLESLSAMMDDEAESLEVRRVIKSLEHSSESSPELLGHWRRYHAVRASLQHEIHAVPAIDLLASVRAGLAEDTTFSNKTGVFRKSVRTVGMFRVVGQSLIAATVAAAVLVAYPLLNHSQNGLSPDVSTAAMVANRQAPIQDSLPVMNGDYNASALTRTVSLDDEARVRLESAVRSFSGTTAVLSSSNSAMFVNQLRPFATNAPVTPAVEQPAQRR